MAEPVIMPCTCANPGQDSLYGKNMRVFNVIDRKDKTEKRCTCCKAKK